MSTIEKLILTVEKLGGRPDLVEVHPSRVPQFIEWCQSGILLVKSWSRDENGRLIVELNHEDEAP